jgi:heat shock protein HtpX
MERTRVGADLGLSARMTLCLILLAGLYLPFVLWGMAIAYGLSGSRASAGLAGAIALVLLGLTPYLSERVVLGFAPIEEADRGVQPKLYALVERLSAMLDLPPPRIAVALTDVPNAYSAGRSRRRAVIVLTRGLLERLDERELEAVVAHELAHIANRDAFVMTLVAVPTLLGRKFLWGIARLPFNAASPAAAVARGFLLLYLLPFLFVGWIVYSFATFLVMTISRYREYAADRGAALITGAPENLMSALQTITGALPQIPDRDLREAAPMNAFFVLPADYLPDTFEVDPLRLFPTHPPLDRRLAQLSELARRIGRPAPLATAGSGERSYLRARPRPGNPHAVAALLLALFVWGLVAGTWLLGPGADTDAVVSVPLLGSAALLLGVVLAFQGAGRASAGASGMGYALTALILLLGPWAIAVVLLVVFVALALLGVTPIG